MATACSRTSASGHDLTMRTHRDLQHGWDQARAQLQRDVWTDAVEPWRRSGEEHHTMSAALEVQQLTLIVLPPPVLSRRA
jgi:hypothetical protein